MSRPIRHLLFIAGAFTFGCMAQTIAAASGENTFEIVVGNGPHAETYKPPADTVICLHAKKQKRYSAAWKDFNAHDPKAMAEAGINVSNPDDAGSKQGEVRIAFGDPDKNPTVYSVDQAPLTLTRTATGAKITFQGKSKEGIPLRVIAKCSDVEEM